MEFDTVIALIVVMTALNLPFYGMCLDTWRTVMRIKAQCPSCTELKQELTS